jgi:Domain of unknown function (DUF4149)
MSPRSRRRAASRATRSRASAISEPAFLPRRLRQLAAWLTGAWAGLVAGIGFVAAPALFATLARADAGRVAARLFALDAYLGVGFGAVLLVLALRDSHARALAGVSRFSVELMLALGALFCIVAGYFALEPMMAAARSGAPGPSFALLHGVAAAFFVVKFVAVAVLAWRWAGGAVATAAAPTS